MKTFLIFCMSLGTPVVVKLTEPIMVDLLVPMMEVLL